MGGVELMCCFYRKKCSKHEVAHAQRVDRNRVHELSQSLGPGQSPGANREVEAAAGLALEGLISLIAQFGDDNILALFSN